MKRMQSLMAGVLGAGAVVAGASAQNAIEWRVADGGNGHWYADDAGAPARTFAGRSQDAASVGAHLATVTSLSEHQFVLQVAFPTGFLGPGQMWPALGGQKAAGSSLWTWVTGEPFGYAPFSPDPAHPELQQWLMMWGENGNQPRLWWTGNSNATFDRAIFEWDADCNNDGIVDYGQIVAGELLDANHNNIPDCCEGAGPCPGEAVQWRTTDGGNGHWYQRIRRDGLAWSVLKARCESLGGHLASITSAAESSFSTTVMAGQNCILGGMQDAAAADYSEPAGGWRWSSNEPFSWTNWQKGEPNNYLGEDVMGAYPTGKWVDLAANAGDLGWPVSFAIIEFDADCNNDGIVDYGQILAGELPDANHNNIPDCCEQGTPCFLTQGLVAHYPLDGNANDASGYGHHASEFNTAPTTDRFGVANAAYRFNGTSAYMTASGVPIPANNVFTWSVWIKADQPNANRPIIERAQAIGVNLLSPHLWTNPDASLRWGSYLIGTGGSTVFTPPGSLPANQWLHFVGTSAANGRRAVYLNGQLVAESISPAYGQELELFIFGRDRMDDLPIEQRYFLGALDDIRIYNRELSAAEVLALYRWPIVDSDGDGVADSSDNCPNIANPTQADCNSDGVGDACEIAAGALDRDHDGIPDSCQCPADIDRNNLVNGVDLAIILSKWGTNGGADYPGADVDRSGIVDGGDLAQVLNSWGPCQ